MPVGVLRREKQSMGFADESSNAILEWQQAVLDLNIPHSERYLGNSVERSFFAALSQLISHQEFSFVLSKIVSVVAPIGPLIEATMNSKQGVKQD